MGRTEWGESCSSCGMNHGCLFETEEIKPRLKMATFNYYD
jgi:hypothetical protein